MKEIKCILIFVLFTASTYAQVRICGKVFNETGEPLIGANVYVKGTYDGASTDSIGYFKFTTDSTGKQLLAVSFLSYKNLEIELDLSKKIEPLTITLVESMKELDPVTINVGAFEAGDKKRSVTLKLLDITTTPSALGDVFGALSSFPGSQIVGDKGGLYVRGGEGYETKTYIDGLQATNPYFSSLPDLPSRGRFSPTLFSGTVYATGGYSAEFGQALSSVVNLNSIGIADETQSAVSLTSVGVNASQTQRWDKSSLALTANYSNLIFTYKILKNNIGWVKYPESVDFTTIYRHKRGKYGLFKLYGFVNLNSASMHYNPSADEDGGTVVSLKNKDIYLNTIYTDKLSDKWRIRVGFSFTKDNLSIMQDTFKVSEPVFSAHQKLILTNKLNDHFSLKLGEDISIYSFSFKYFSFLDLTTFKQSFLVTNPALFAESEISINSRLAIRTGLRGEYLSLMNEKKLSPRISFAYKYSRNAQISFAYGQFTQRPENEYLLYNNKLKSEKASHYIINYQYEKNNQIFRVEGYKKTYKDLVKYLNENNIDPLTYNNRGYGYSMGIDVFWRDSKTLKNMDYWISYSYINTKRDYKNYTKDDTPPYISPHTFSVVVKYMFPKIDTHIGINYTYASIKNWFNPNLGDNIHAKVKAYNDISLNIIYMTSVWKKLTVLYFNVNNICGFNNVFGYNYNKDTLYPIVSTPERFFLIGAFISFK
ncbi:MAG: TonB-dependent receptor [Bacteroidales bacterium]|nr:TonB-dependent receptor [Bacteroidales bacterium]